MGEEEKRTVTISTMPPLLKARLDYYKKKPPHFYPAFDRVFIIPLDDADQMDTTAGGIAIAQETKNKLGAQRGLLVAAGAKAIEELYSMGIGLGHVVYTMRFSRFERTYQSKEDRMFYRAMICTAGEVMGSEDLYNAIEAGDISFQLDVKEGTVQVCDRENDRPRNDPPPREYGV